MYHLVLSALQISTKIPAKIIPLCMYVSLIAFSQRSAGTVISTSQKCNLKEPFVHYKIKNSFNVHYIVSNSNTPTTHFSILTYCSTVRID